MLRNNLIKKHVETILAEKHKRSEERKLHTPMEKPILFFLNVSSTKLNAIRFKSQWD